MTERAWRVKVTPGDVGEVLAAEHCNLAEGGALRLWSGHPFTPTVVRLYAPGAWHTAEPEKEPTRA